MAIQQNNPSLLVCPFWFEWLHILEIKWMVQLAASHFRNLIDKIRATAKFSSLFYILHALPSILWYTEVKWKYWVFFTHNLINLSECYENLGLATILLSCNHLKMLCSMNGICSFLMLSSSFLLLFSSSILPTTVQKVP